MVTAPFRNANFRRLFAGRLVTNLGDSLYFVGAMWIVHELTGDPFFTGLAGFLTLLPGIFQFLAGPFVDKWPLRRTLVGTQVMQGTLVFIIPIAHFFGVLTVEVVLVVMPVLATLNEFANPAMVTALPRLLEDEELVAANSAFSIASQGTDMIGNGAAGLFIGILGAVSLFALDAVTFGIATILFASVTIPAVETSQNEQGTNPSSSTESDGEASVTDNGSVADEEDSYIDELRLGFRFVRNTVLMWLFFGGAVINFSAGMALAAMPAYADTLEVPRLLAVVGAPGAYGILMASFSAGTFVGALAANFIDDKPFGWTLIVGFVTAGFLWTGAIAADWLPVTALLLALAFVPIGSINIQMAALIQSAPPKEIVGRVSSLLGSVTVATIPIGSLAGGVVAGTFGAQTAMSVVGFGLVALAGYILVLSNLRTLPSTDQINISG